MKARLISYTTEEKRIITGKLDLEIALLMQDELRKTNPLDEHKVFITE